jgi:hypothetical protein
MYLPIRLCCNSHLCHRSDDFANNHADNSKNGVVGSSGIIMPSKPNARLIKPKAVKSFSYISNIHFYPSTYIFPHKHISFPSIRQEDSDKSASQTPVDMLLSQILIR